MLSIAVMTKVIAVLVLAGQALLVLFVLGLPWRTKSLKKLYAAAGEFALLGAFITALGGVLGSLYFSEIAKYLPCELCWYQRILLYPQALLFGLALLKKNRDVVVQGVVLSGLGFAIATYQTYLQYGGSALVPCSANSLAGSCGQKNFLEFGFITLPVMALTGFAMILVAMLLEHWRTRRNTATK